MNDGGTAFPARKNEVDALPGMSLRDWFAGMALQGVLSCPTTDGSDASFAKGAYEYADAMLLARKAKDGDS